MSVNISRDVLDRYESIQILRGKIEESKNEAEKCVQRDPARWRGIQADIKGYNERIDGYLKEIARGGALPKQAFTHTNSQAANPVEQTTHAVFQNQTGAGLPTSSSQTVPQSPTPAAYHEFIGEAKGIYDQLLQRAEQNPQRAIEYYLKAYNTQILILQCQNLFLKGSDIQPSQFAMLQDLAQAMDANMRALQNNDQRITVALFPQSDLYQNRAQTLNLCGHHSGSFLNDPSSAIVQEYGSPHDRSNLNHSENPLNSNFVPDSGITNYHELIGEGKHIYDQLLQRAEQNPQRAIEYYLQAYNVQILILQCQNLFLRDPDIQPSQFAMLQDSIEKMDVNIRAIQNTDFKNHSREARANNQLRSSVPEKKETVFSVAPGEKVYARRGHVSDRLDPKKEIKAREGVEAALQKMEEEEKNDEQTGAEIEKTLKRELASPENMKALEEHRKAQGIPVVDPSTVHQRPKTGKRKIGFSTVAIETPVGIKTDRAGEQRGVWLNIQDRENKTHKTYEGSGGAYSNKPGEYRAKFREPLPRGIQREWNYGKTEAEDYEILTIPNLSPMHILREKGWGKELGHEYVIIDQVIYRILQENGHIYGVATIDPVPDSISTVLEAQQSGYPVFQLA